MADKAKNKNEHRCPPLPEGWTAKFTGPAYDGESAAHAAAKWGAYLRELKRLVPCPRQSR